LREMVQVDAQAIVAYPIDDPGEAAVESLVAHAFVIKRRQHEDSADAPLCSLELVMKVSLPG